jgi:hypothetical protein
VYQAIGEQLEELRDTYAETLDEEARDDYEQSFDRLAAKRHPKKLG